MLKWLFLDPNCSLIYYLGQFLTDLKITQNITILGAILFFEKIAIDF
jgi:hypothetical protein